MKAKEADTRTANSIASDREPLAQGESDGAMPDPSSEAVTRSHSTARRVLSATKVRLTTFGLSKNQPVAVQFH
eukprot:6203374-Pleurochrysis_carterae.AAC.1